MNQLHQLFQMKPTPIVPADRLGLVGELLHELGVPVSIAALLGPFLLLVLALSVLYGLFRVVLRPVFGWTLTRCGVDDHSKQLLLDC